MKPGSAGGIFIKSKISSPYSLTKDELRSFLVRYHSLDTYDSFEGKAGVKKLLRRIGSVQYDPLNVVGRNPDLVFQARVKNYTGGLLEELLYADRSLVDGFDKEMSIYLTEDWPRFSRVRGRSEEAAKRVLEYRKQEEVLSSLPRVLDEIKKRGPLSAREIKLGACQKNRWGHRQVSGAALDYLNSSGKIGIHKKINTQKVYDLIENLVPQKILRAPDFFADDGEFLEWYVLRRIGSVGVYWRRNGGGWLGHYLGDSNSRGEVFDILEEKKLIVPVKVEETGEIFYMRRKDTELLGKKNQYDGAIRILAPLDNMLWDRLLVNKVFDFQYTWEVYVPEVKRKYGYYVLPVLYRNNLIARLEPLKHESGRPFGIKNWWWEPEFNPNGGGADSGAKSGDRKTGVKKAEIREAVEKGFDNFARYLGAGGGTYGVERKTLAAIFG